MSISGWTDIGPNLTRAYYKRKRNDAGNPQKVPYAKPTAGQVSNWQNRLALGKELEGSGASINTQRATNRLKLSGQDLEGGDWASALLLMASRGAKGGKLAEFYTQMLALKNLKEWGKEASAAGTDDISKAYQGVTDQFTSALGPGVDMGSPAVLDAVRRYVEGRSTSTAEYAHGIAGQVAAGERDILLGQIAPTLNATGALIESLNMLQEEQDRMDAASRGSVLGSPTAYGGQLLSGGNWSATDSTANQSGLAFSNSLWTSIQRSLSVMAATQGMNQGGGQNLNHPTNTGAGNPGYNQPTFVPFSQ